MPLENNLSRLNNLYNDCINNIHPNKKNICEEFRDLTYKLIIKSHKNKDNNNNNNLFKDHPPYLHV